MSIKESATKAWQWLTENKNTVAHSVEVAAICILLWMLYSNIFTHPVKIIPMLDTTPASIKQAIEGDGHVITISESQRISDKISEAKKATPTVQSRFTADSEASGVQQASKFAQASAKKDKADVVLSDPPAVTQVTTGVEVQANYYGIHYAKKRAISVYADTKGIGLGYRQDKVQVDVGKTFTGSTEVRVHYDMLQF